MYNDFAEVYDRLQDADYEKFADYYEEIFAKYCKKRPELVLDLGCGTGNITLPLSRRGFDMIGLDLSCEMLNIAREKAYDAGENILFLNQDMADFELYGTVDAIVCALDGVNYLTDPSDLKRLFRLADNYLNPGGVMVIDINSEYKLREVLGCNTFVNEEQGLYYVWRNNFSEDTRICEFELNFFISRDDGTYTRFDEFQAERAYTTDEIKAAANGSCLCLRGAFVPFTFENASKNDERIFFVFQKTY